MLWGIKYLLKLNNIMIGKKKILETPFKNREIDVIRKCKGHYEVFCSDDIYKYLIKNNTALLCEYGQIENFNNKIIFLLSSQCKRTIQLK